MMGVVNIRTRTHEDITRGQKSRKRKLKKRIELIKKPQFVYQKKPIHFITGRKLEGIRIFCEKLKTTQNTKRRKKIFQGNSGLSMKAVGQSGSGREENVYK